MKGVGLAFSPFLEIDSARGVIIGQVITPAIGVFLAKIRPTGPARRASLRGSSANRSRLFAKQR